MTVYSFEDLRDHVGHAVEVRECTDDEGTTRVSIECCECGEVLFIFDSHSFAS